MKKCTKCGELSEKLNPWCNSCMNEKLRKYYKTKEGLFSKIYNNQINGCKARNRKPPTYTKQELKDWLFCQIKFHKLYDEWVKSDYAKMLVPSIDRIYNNKTYSFDNIQLMTWKDNQEKARQDERNGILSNKRTPHQKVKKYNLQKQLLNTYVSQKEASRQTGIAQSCISACCLGKIKKSNGFIWVCE